MNTPQWEIVENPPPLTAEEERLFDLLAWASRKADECWAYVGGVADTKEAAS